MLSLLFVGKRLSWLETRLQIDFLLIEGDPPMVCRHYNVAYLALTTQFYSVSWMYGQVGAVCSHIYLLGKDLTYMLLRFFPPI